MAYQGIDQSENHLSKLLEIADMFSLTIEGAHRLFGYGFMIATANPIGASRMGALARLRSGLCMDVLREGFNGVSLPENGRQRSLP
jgi:hypothetical protein